MPHHVFLSPSCLVLGIALSVSAGGLGGCASPARAPEPPASGAGADATAKRGATDKGRHAEIIGRWTPTLPPHEARAITIGRAVLANPPDRQALEAMHPTDEDRRTYERLVALRETDDHGPILTTIRRKMADFDEILFEITPTTLGSSGPGGRDTYRVLADDGDALTLGVKGDQIDVRIIDKDHLSMRDSRRTFLLTRDSAIAGDAATPVAAWNGSTPRPGRDGFSRAAKSNVVVPGPGAATPAPGAARDACTAYADCIDQMPRLSGDAAGMGASSATIRGWEKTPERLRQCASAHELARAGTLCR